MAEKEDPMKNFGAVCHGSTAAERVEVAEEVHTVMPHPLPRNLLGRQKRAETEEVSFSLRPCSSRPEDSGLVYGGVRACSVGHTPLEEEKEADLVYGGLLPCAGRHLLAKQDGEMKDSLTAAKRKADDSQVAAAGASSDEKVENTGSGDVKAPEIKWVEMSLEYIAWLLGQKRERDSSTPTDENGNRPGELILDVMANDEAGKEEFFAFQDWVRETFDWNGCVMVPEGFNGQDLIDEAWEKGKRELEMIDGCPPFNKEEELEMIDGCSFNKEEDTAAALPSN